MAGPFFLGVDVGTGSARAGVFDAAGRMLGSGKHEIALYRASGDIAEQSSSDIWQAVAASVREAVSKSRVDADDIIGIGFDATCSLVVVGAEGTPLPVGDAAERNIMVWMDHRAHGQATRINATGHGVLDYVGGAISPEMETPKLLWLKENRPDTYSSAWQFFDLADYLTWRATGSLVRSACTLACKWTFLAHENRWDEDYFREIGLEDLAREGFARVGTEVVPGGSPLGEGLTAAAAADFGLRTGTAVGAGLIDAHAGGLGTVGAGGGSGVAESRMAYVFGTSACTMTSTKEPVFVPGVWGPYSSAMVPGLWLNEGGQSAAGAALDQLVLHHPASAVASAAAATENLSLVEWLALQAEGRGGAGEVPQLVGELHVVPEFLGNRSPLADPSAKALVAGVGMDRGVDSLVGLYLGGLAGLGYGVRHILEVQAAKGIVTELVVVSGGAARGSLVRQVLADSIGLPVAATDADEPVLAGSAILGALACGYYGDAATAMAAMTRIGARYDPLPETREWHDTRSRAYRILQAAGTAIRRL
jgi:D-ribulokinase